MIPLLAKLRLPGKNARTITLYFPVFLVWLLLFMISILLLPFLFIAAVLTWKTGQGRIIINTFPMIFITIWHMRGLLIDVKTSDVEFYLSFI